MGFINRNGGMEHEKNIAYAADLLPDDSPSNGVQRRTTAGGQ